MRLTASGRFRAPFLSELRLYSPRPAGASERASEHCRSPRARPPGGGRRPVGVPLFLLGQLGEDPVPNLRGERSRRRREAALHADGIERPVRDQDGRRLVPKQGIIAVVDPVVAAPVVRRPCPRSGRAMTIIAQLEARDVLRSVPHDEVEVVIAEPPSSAFATYLPDIWDFRHHRIMPTPGATDRSTASLGVAFVFVVFGFPSSIKWRHWPMRPETILNHRLLPSWIYRIVGSEPYPT